MSNELVCFDCTKCFQRETTLSNSTLTFSIVASWQAKRLINEAWATHE